MKSKIGYFYVALTTIIWGINPTIFKSLSGFTSPNIQNFFRMLVAGIFLWICSKYLLKPEGDSDINNPKMGLLSYLFPAIIIYVFDQLLINGISLSKANISAFVLSGFNPIITITLLGLFIAEERKQLKNIYVKTSILLGLVGVILAMINFKDGTKISLDFGLFLVFLGAITWSFYAVAIKKFFSHVNSIIFFRNIYLMNAVFFFITILITKEIFLLSKLSLNLIFGLIITGLIADALASLTFFLGITKVSAVKANIFFLLAPVISLLVSKIILNETLTLQQLLGCLLVSMASSLLVFMEIGNQKEITNRILEG